MGGTKSPSPLNKTSIKKIDATGLNTTSINQAVKEEAKNNKRILIENVKPLDSLCVGLQEDVEILIKGGVADYCGALNDGAKILIEGNAQRFLGDCMTSGEIIVRKSVGYGAGIGMRGGVIVIYGNAGDSIGQIKKGGVLLVDGDVGSVAGLFMMAGDIIATGTFGERVGDWMVGGAIYFGRGVKQLGANTQIVELNAEDKEKLTLLFKKYGISAEVEGFRKIIPKKLRPFYGG